MSYSDVIGAIQNYQHLTGGMNAFANKANQLDESNLGPMYTGGQPTRGPSTFFGSTSRNLYENADYSFDDPSAMYKDEKGNWIKPTTLQRGLGALQTGGMTAQVSPYLSKGLQYGYNFATGAPAGTQLIQNAAGQQISLAPGAAMPEGYSAVGIGPGLAGGMMLKSFTDDKNPYTYTSKEKFGDYAGNALIASSLAPSLGIAAGSNAIMGVHPGVLLASLAFSWLSGKKKKRKAKRLRKEAVQSVEDQQWAGYEDRSKAVKDAQEEYLSDAGQMMWEKDASQYDNQYGGAYNNPYYGYGDKGMKFTPKEYKKIAKAGRNGDTMLAHINPQEAQMLKAMGGSGTINPYTGLREYGWFSGFVKGLGNILTGGASAVSNTLDDLGVTDAVSSGFDAAGNVIDPFADAAGNAITATGDVINQGINTSLDLTRDVMGGGLDAAGNVLEATSDVVYPVLDPAMDLVTDITQPVMEGIHDVTKPIMAGATDIAKMGIEGTLSGIKNVGHGAISFLNSIFGGGTGGGFNVGAGQNLSLQQKRESLMKDPEVHPLKLRDIGTESPSGLEDQDIANLYAEGFRGDLDNPYIRENVLELAKGGLYANINKRKKAGTSRSKANTTISPENYKKMKEGFYDGGKIDAVAEFTGNELIVNNQDAVEKGLSKNNYSMAAAPIRNAMKQGFITPGLETHMGNPMPVDKDGNIYTKGGKLKFKVKKGAGIYDHATDQFKPNMTDKEIAMIAKKNIAKWKSNGMA